MFYGDSFFSHKGTHSVKFFKENGFITGHIVDMCSKEQYNIRHTSNENVGFLCDNNFKNVRDHHFYGGTSVRGSLSSMEKCLYGKKSK